MTNWLYTRMETVSAPTIWPLVSVMVAVMRAVSGAGGAINWASRPDAESVPPVVAQKMCRESYFATTRLSGMYVMVNVLSV